MLYEFICGCLLQHAVTEMLAFFQVSNLSVDDIKHMAQQSIGHIADVSRLALQYAIQQHTVTVTCIIFPMLNMTWKMYLVISLY